MEKRRGRPNFNRGGKKNSSRLRACVRASSPSEPRFLLTLSVEPYDILALAQRESRKEDRLAQDKRAMCLLAPSRTRASRAKLFFFQPRPPFISLFFSFSLFFSLFPSSNRCTQALPATTSTASESSSGRPRDRYEAKKRERDRLSE